MKKVITQKEFEVLERHTLHNFSWYEEGTFNREDKNGDWVFDKKEAAIVERALSKLDAHVRGTTEEKTH